MIKHRSTPPPTSAAIDSWIVRATRITLFVFFALAGLVGWFRILVPALWEQGDVGHVLALVAIAAGVLGLAPLAWLGRRIFVPNRRPDREDRQ